jgi:magnesium transporter
MIETYPPGIDPLASATWIDLLQPTAEEIERVRVATGLRVPTESQISEIESSSRLGFENGAYYLSAPILSPRDDGEPALVPVGLVLSACMLLTVRYARVPAIEDARAHCIAAQTHTAEEAFLHIFEVIVDRSADKLEHARSECDELSRGAFRQGARAAKTGGSLQLALQHVGIVADRVSLIRDTLLGVGRIGAYVIDGGIAAAPPVNRVRMKAIVTDVASLTDYQSHLSSKVQFLLDATLGFINIEQNDIVKILTIASVAGIPPVLIVGIYGMNFRVMPELEWRYGYPVAMVAIVLSALLPIAWFKRRGWM